MLNQVPFNKAVLSLLLISLLSLVPNFGNNSLQVESIGLKIDLQNIKSHSPGTLAYRLVLKQKFPVDADIEYEVQTTNLKIKQRAGFGTINKARRRDDVWLLELNQGQGNSNDEIQVRTFLGDRIIDHQVLKLSNEQGHLKLITHEDYMRDHMRKPMTPSPADHPSYQQKALIYSVWGWFLISLFYLFQFRKSDERSKISLPGSVLSKILLIISFIIFAYHLDSYYRDKTLEQSAWDITTAEILKSSDFYGLGYFVEYKIPGIETHQTEFVFHRPSESLKKVPVFYCVEDPSINAIASFFRWEGWMPALIFGLFLTAILYFNAHFLEAEIRALHLENSPLKYIPPIIQMGLSAFIGSFFLDYGYPLWGMVTIFLRA